MNRNDIHANIPRTSFVDEPYNGKIDTVQASEILICIAMLFLAAVKFFAG